MGEDGLQGLGPVVAADKKVARLSILRVNNGFTVECYGSVNRGIFIASTIEEAMKIAGSCLEE